MIAKSYLNNILHNLALEIQTAEPNCTVVHFGSSLYSQPDNRMDVDIMILTEQDYSTGNYSTQLAELRERLVAGRQNSEFQLHCSIIEVAIRRVIDAEKARSNITLIPKFIFGPYVAEPTKTGEFAIFLHFKGPITCDQLAEFCTTFPFHGKSIIHNSSVIRGSFDPSYFDQFIVLRKEELEIFIEGLRIRATHMQTGAELRKCIKKIVLLYNLFHGILTNDQSLIYKTMPIDFNIATVLKSEDPLILLQLFEKIYTWIMKSVQFPSSLLIQQRL